MAKGVFPRPDWVGEQKEIMKPEWVKRYMFYFAD
jgi:hypothetical protein